jgi:Bacterial PH domain
MPSMLDVRKQVVTGLVPPQLNEAIIRERWPSVAASPLAGPGRALMRTIVLAPLAWLLLAIPYFKKVLPFLATRYTLTNRRLMIRRGLKAVPAQEVALADIDEVRIREGSEDPFFRAATIDIVSGGKVVLSLPAVPGAEAVCHAIRSACQAWTGKQMTPRPPSAAESSGKK